MHFIMTQVLVMTSTRRFEPNFWGSTFVKLKKSNIVPMKWQAPLHTPQPFRVFSLQVAGSTHKIRAFIPWFINGMFENMIS
jgi:hypothetical protein